MGEAQLSLIANDALTLEVHFQCLFTFNFIKSKVSTYQLLIFYCKKMAFTIDFTLFPLYYFYLRIH